MGFKIGDLVETCSLMPGIIMNIDYDDIEIRLLDKEEIIISHCSIIHCGILKITPQQMINRLLLGKDKLIEIWNQSESPEDYLNRIDK